MRASKEDTTSYSYLYLLLTALCINLVYFMHSSFMFNEMDVLPSALHFVNNSFASSDWYLNLGIEYRYLFNTLAGHIIDFAGFYTGTHIGRFIVICLFSISIALITDDLKIKWGIFLLTFIGYVDYKFIGQNIGAGEWITGSFDTKAFAYAFLLAAIYFCRADKIKTSMLLLGLSLSFHVLVGIYGGFVLLLAYLLTTKNYLETLKNILLNCWPALITGAYGLFTIFSILTAPSTSSEGWTIYVNFRVPHHTLPEWQPAVWIFHLTAFFISVGVITSAKTSLAQKFYSRLVLTSMVLMLIGIAIYKFADIEIMRYYFFRVPSAFIPLFTFLVIASITSQILVLISRKTNISQSVYNCTAALCAASIYLAIHKGAIISKLDFNYWSEQSFFNNTAFDPQMAQWITNNTPVDTTFLVSPNVYDFYITTQRNIFVSYKHSPQSSADIAEWANRLSLATGTKTKFTSPGEPKEINEYYQSLDEREVRELGERYNIDYVIFEAHQPKNLELLFATEKHNLYKL